MSPWGTFLTQSTTLSLQSIHSDGGDDKEESEKTLSFDGGFERNRHDGATEGMDLFREKII